jgi:alcohol dehydrogenase YqhD (iron-dependent ADH family)
MEDFVFQNRTKVVFGRGKENDVGTYIKPYAEKALLHYGGGSIKRKIPYEKSPAGSSLYDRICSSFKRESIEWEELPGVQPNPRVDLVRRGIVLCREQKIPFILAVGGGSVIDSAKAIAAGVRYSGDVWDLFGGKQVKEALPVGVVLTIPAAGSESSNGSVITNEDGWYKRAMISELLRPRFAVLNPELSFTLSQYQTMVGIADIMAHLIERYFTKVEHVDVSDRLIEGTMRSIISNSRILLEDPGNYDARAEVMWAGTLAHNDLFSCGRIGDWASHEIEHELSGIYDVPHGAGLSVIIPAWMTYVCRKDPKNTVPKVAQFADRVWNVDTNTEAFEGIALEGAARLKSYFRALGIPTSLRELGVSSDRFGEMAKKCTERGPVGNFVRLYEEDVMEIFRLAEE